MGAVSRYLHQIVKKSADSLIENFELRRAHSPYVSANGWK
jgi:hypothetical protein